MEKLNEVEIQEELLELKNWKLTNNKWIERKYRFQDYIKGIEFVQKIAYLSEEMDHHPFISIDYKIVTLKITSWRVRGLTGLDFELARRFDEIYQEI